ncbi:MAG: beta-eliminating lyase-related protein [Muribaculaceae bacterium]|nr:beta-eliminating lyase-related protein [Muribaculaceae bacterium]
MNIIRLLWRRAALSIQYMIHFENDYSTGAHPEILSALSATNMEGNTGYGLDRHTRNSEELILNIIDPDRNSKHSVYFLAGGTQTNAVGLHWLCRPGEGVLAADSAHINVHESGAIEAGMLKVIALPECNGKLQAQVIDKYMEAFYADPTWPHIVRPTTVYISQPTELGTLYSRREFQEIAEVCRKYNLALYLDGARLVYALAADDNDLTLYDIAQLTDMFYVGGTKAGTLYGEALVTSVDGDERHRFFSHIKRHGALLAKGWLAAAQFEAMFNGDLYKRIGTDTIRLAKQLRKVLHDAGCKELYPMQTNQLFFELTDNQLEVLAGKVAVDVQRRLTDKTYLVRFVVDWSNTSEDVNTIETILRS